MENLFAYWLKKGLLGSILGSGQDEDESIQSTAFQCYLGVTA